MIKVDRAIKTVMLLMLFSAISPAQNAGNSEVKSLIAKYKKSQKGPYKAIKWFCPDGSIVPPDQRCAEKGGVQRAQYLEEVEGIAKSKGIYLGQILAATPFEDFFDGKNFNSRLKQYQLEKYLRNIDNGWVLQKAQFYRGAFQAEDEETWGIDFFDWLLQDKDFLKSEFFFVREIAKDIPHAGDDNKTQSIRNISKTISDSMNSFMDLRVKIHGQPEADDINKVKSFIEKNKSKIKPEISELITKLIADMETVYKPADLSALAKYIKRLPDSFALKAELKKLSENSGLSGGNLSAKISVYEKMAELLLEIRKNIDKVNTTKQKLALLDISLKLENILFREIDNWPVTNLSEAVQKNNTLAKAIVGSGYIESWEWEKLESFISVPAGNEISLEKFSDIVENSRRIVEWGSSMINANYKKTVALFEPFEPLAHGFIDDKIRSTLLLAMGRLNSRFGALFAGATNVSNQVFDLDLGATLRGLNSGFAQGELVVVSGNAEDIDFDASKIYALYRPASDLKPVAGILTVTEGNLVSHVQLLARNLAIPNAVISDEGFQAISKFSGKKVFYAVSKKGRVILKLQENMTDEEKKLFAVKKVSDEIITVPTNKLELTKTEVINLRELRAKDSGKLCGPKAANLAQLKSIFPDKVVEGVVVPFGIFRDHMQQTIPGKTFTYWQFLDDTFTNLEKMKEKTSQESDSYVLTRLAELREFIKTMPMNPEFSADLENKFGSAFSKPVGEIPVFIRSDTNMEDLKDFTGAGLNLTVFNVLEKAKIFQAIRDVWASPYSERSYKWRQRLLKNPENVYPSILIIPSVDVEKSGVMITTGVSTGDSNDVTVSFSRGAGGAVEGQITETYVLKPDGRNILISASRELTFNTLPSSGGTGQGSASLSKPILSGDELNQLRQFAALISQNLTGTPGIESNGPFDVELGFKNSKLWLFQVRPFVESKKALASSYIQSLDANPVTKTTISLDEKL